MKRNRFLNDIILISIMILIFTGCNGQVEDVKEDEKPIEVKILNPDEYITPNWNFFSITIGEAPKINQKDWKLEITGKVKNSFSITYKEILSLPETMMTSTLECIGNAPDGKTIGSANWKGVRLKTILARAVPEDTAKEVVFYAADGYYSSLTIEEALDPSALLVYNMNGQKLSRDQGFPLRLIHPKKYGIKNPMWLTKIEVVDYGFKDYWEKRGWNVDVDVLISSKIVYPKDRKKYKNEPISVWGYVWGGAEGIEKVEISFDDGKTWVPAELKFKPKKKYLWTKWEYKWTPPGPGKFNVLSRATDKKGNIQPFIVKDTLGGNNSIHTITIEIKKKLSKPK